MASTSAESKESLHHDREHGREPAVGQEKNQEKTTAPGTNPEPPLDPAPDGGLEAWLVAVGAGSIFFSCMGFTNSFGTFTEFYLSNQLKGESPDKIAWIGSIAVFLQFFTGMIGGPMFDRYGAKVVRPAIAAYVFAMMMLSLCKTYWQIMLVQGILMGIIMGFLQFPAMGAVSQFFDKKRAVALGIAVSGSSIGGIVMPILISSMLNSTSLGFGWSVRVIGFIIMPFMALTLITLKTRVPPKETSFFLLSAFKNRMLSTLIVGIFFVFMGVFMPIIFLPTYAVRRGMDSTLAGYLPAILNGASTLGRILPGIVADRYGKINMFAAGSVITAVCVFAMNAVESKAALIVYAAVFGFTSGTIVSGAAVSLTACVDDVRNMGTYTGMGLSLGAIGSLIGPPMDGLFISRYDSFLQASMFSAAVCLFGGIVIFLAKLGSPKGLFGIL